MEAERALGAELARTAEALLAGIRPKPLDPDLDQQLATAHVLLALYWELRHQLAGPSAARLNEPADRAMGSEPGA